MKYFEFYQLLDEIIEEAPGTVQANTILRELAGWDSLAVLSLIALVDERFSQPLAGNAIAACVTAGDLSGLLGSQLTE